jgi:hypothetical protein
MDLNDLQNKIHEDLAWRKQEISNIKSIVGQSDDLDSHIFRSTQVMIASHWEGFLKQSASTYINYVFSQDRNVWDFSHNIIALAFFDVIRGCAETKYPGSDGHDKFAEKILKANFIDNKINKIGGAKWKVDTEGNPGTGTLARILKSIGVEGSLNMPEAEWETTKKFIDEQLLKDRNAIAHGGKDKILKEDIVLRIDRLLRLLDSLGEAIMDAAISESYIRKV